MDTAVAKRSQKWDILKFILIFLVVLGHAAEYYTGGNEHMRALILFIYTFHMPLFIFVSGLFAKNTVNNKRYDKASGYLVIYVFLKILFYVVKIIIGRKPEFNLFVEGGVPWFMLAVFAFSLITMAVRKLPKTAVLSVSIILACVAGFFPQIRDFLALSRIIVFYPFFYLGYCLDRKSVETFCRGKTKKIVSLIILSVIAVLVFLYCDEIYSFRYLFTARNPYSALGKFETAGVWLRLLFYPVVSAIGFCVISLVPDKIGSGKIAVFGQRTLAVYGFHYVALYLIFDLMKIKPFFAELMGGYDEWVIVPLSVIITLLFSLKFWNGDLAYLMILPVRISEKISKVRHRV